MKMRSIPLIFFIICIILTGCNKNSILQISKYNEWTDLDIDSFLKNAREEKERYNVTFLVTNNEGEDIYYSTKWLLEVFEEGAWYRIDFKRNDNGNNYGWEDARLILEKGKKKEITIPLFGYYETPLPKGIYRMTQPVSGSRLFSLYFEV